MSFEEVSEIGLYMQEAYRNAASLDTQLDLYEGILTNEFAWSDTVFPEYLWLESGDIEWSAFEKEMADARKHSNHLQDALDIYERIVDEKMHKNGYEDEVRNYLTGVGYDGEFKSDRPLAWLAEDIGKEAANLGTFVDLEEIGSHFYYNNFGFGYNQRDRENVEDASNKLENTVQDVDKALERLNGMRGLAEDAVDENLVSKLSNLFNMNSVNMGRIEEINRLDPVDHELAAYNQIDRLDFDELKKSI